MTATVRTPDGKIIGILKGGNLYKKAKKSFHLFKSIGANGSWGIDYDVLVKELPMKAVVHIHEMEDNIEYSARASQWKEYGEVRHFKSDDRDNYTQIFLPIEYFTKRKLN